MQRSRWPISLALILVITACSDGATEKTAVSPETTVSPTASSTTTTTAAPATVAPTTTTIAGTTVAPATTVATTTTTTTAPTTTTTSDGPFLYVTGMFPDVLGGPLDAHGSGCAPGAAGPLPDGIWFGFPTAWTTSSMDFDLACFYSGDAATAQAAARGEESPPPNDYIITNDNPTLRNVPVAAGAIGYRLDNNIATLPVPFADFITDQGEFQDCFQFCLMWLYVNGGAVTEIVSQFVP